MKKSTIIVTIVAILIVTGGITAGTYVNDRMMEKAAKKMAAEDMKDNDMSMEDEETYPLQFLSGIQYQPGQPSLLEFTVVDKDGKRLAQDDYKVTHEKRMHVIVASSDLAHFQHVHPVFDTSSNTYKLPGFVFPVAGEYRIFTDFEVDAHGDEAMDMTKHGGVQYQDVLVGNAADYQRQPLGPATTTDEANGNKVDLKISAVTDGHAKTEKRLDFTITRDGKKVTDLQKYLGALGHLVILREGDLEYLHTHALSTDINKQTGTVSFEADFKEPGNYKAFAQFQRGGEVMTTEFVINVK